MRKKELAKLVIERLKEEYPESHCSLDYDDAWKLLVSVRLAAQCTDARVNVVVQDLYARYPDVAALAAATWRRRPRKKSKNMSIRVDWAKVRRGTSVPA